MKQFEPKITYTPKQALYFYPVWFIKASPNDLLSMTKVSFAVEHLFLAIISL